MNHRDKVNAVLFIRPKSEFQLDGDELTWLDENQTKPTEAEIKAGWVAYQAAQKAEVKAQATAKTTAQAKLAALGLTVEDLTALGL